MPRLNVLLLAAATLLVARTAPAATDEPLVERYLVEGKLAEGEKALLAALERDPKDSQARFGLGVTQFLRGIERMVQSFHRHGLRDVGGGMVPFLRLPVPANPDPEPIRYEDLRGVFAAWLEDMSRVEATLAKIDDPDVILPLHFGLIRLDLDGDGKSGEEETLWKIYARFNGVDVSNLPLADAAEKAKALVIHFDRGDVAWLRGYCHLLSAFAEVYLAHDGRELFNHSANLIFARPETPFPFLRRRGADRREFDSIEIVDMVATIHMIRLPVVEPKRMTSALEHLQAMIGLSRESWSFYKRESDDDNEWIPESEAEDGRAGCPGDGGNGQRVGGVPRRSRAPAGWQDARPVLARVRQTCRHQPETRLHRTQGPRPGPLGPGDRGSSLSRGGPDHQARGLAAAPAHLPGRVHRLRALVQLSGQESEGRRSHFEVHDHSSLPRGSGRSSWSDSSRIVADPLREGAGNTTCRGRPADEPR